MIVYRNFEEIDTNPNTILTVGTFDGVHNGHKVIINTLKKRSKELGLRDVVLTIHPHPQVVLKKTDKEPIKILSTIEERIRLFEEIGVSNLLIVNFTYEFSRTAPESFVKDYLVKKIGMKRILVGYDHMFGKDRVGNRDLLRNLGNELGFDVERMDAHEENNLIISSTKIRNAIKDKQLDLAKELLGYSYSAEGRVVKGDMRGRTIGYPTANLELFDQSKLLPPNGVYFVKVVVDGSEYYGMTNIGYRPTFDGGKKKTFETNIFDFDSDIYGHTIKVVFLKFIREEKKFPGIDELISALKNDEMKCKELVNSK